MTAREIFYQVYGSSKNLMTPRIATRRKKGKRLAYELSTGTGFRNEIIYGVTVVRLVNGEWCKSADDCRLFHTYESAMSYIRTLR